MLFDKVCHGAAVLRGGFSLSKTNVKLSVLRQRLTALTADQRKARTGAVTKLTVGTLDDQNPVKEKTRASEGFRYLT